MYMCMFCTLTHKGAHELTVNTWRPSGFRVLDKMKRFFVGGVPEIDDISYVAQPRDFQVGWGRKSIKETDYELVI